MKNKKLLLTSFVLLALLSSCGSKPEVQKKDANEDSSNVILNLTSIGLYDNTKGTLDENTNIEYAKVLTINPGDALPKDNITCSSTNMKFVTWCYVKANDGLPTYTDKVIKDVNIYQAVFESTVDLMDGVETPNPDTPAPDPTKLVDYYFIDQPWWSKDGASSYIYLFNSSTGDENADWPGVIMEKVSTENGLNTWKYTVDFNKYDKCVIARGNPNPNAGASSLDWGAKTKNIDLSLDKNTITLTNTTELWGNPGCDFVLSLENK